MLVAFALLLLTYLRLRRTITPYKLRCAWRGQDNKTPFNKTLSTVVHDFSPRLTQ
ncbi:hypothetical protein ABB37_05139 [Leptomonas pyrrhocoris]|uniref:Uncharacterized protein n=1 Tax=Leptomonas pyrrhocoris TaxID=157538 RepID=A0A0N0VF48_LEPPY|nr:hypothetical protein ABB37_05139 [Leptomonas pyrrhocoris]KPA80152.1 hypothetical protein ABB37_05139 [Leptomonas pyrrhocoris]|eukprot:XP_015658591.1 hypothetical protein ABB37_05139 [Leptomonas pyrrhocoris]